MLMGADAPRKLTVNPKKVDKSAFTPASEILQRLHDDAPAGTFTLGWLMGSLHKRSFGLILLLLAIVAVTPGVSFIAGLLLMIPAFQMTAGQHVPLFPRRIATRVLPTRHLATVIQRTVPILKYLEKVVHPRWSTPVGSTNRVVGVVVAVLSATLVFTPIPLSNVVPALVIAFISLAYLEEDGLLLSIALLLGLAVLAVEASALWETVVGAEWMRRFW